MNLTAALDQFEDICLLALSIATFLDKKKKVRKSLRGRLKRLVLDVVLLLLYFHGKTKVFFSTDTEMSGEDVLVCSL